MLLLWLRGNQSGSDSSAHTQRHTVYIVHNSKYVHTCKHTQHRQMCGRLHCWDFGSPAAGKLIVFVKQKAEAVVNVTIISTLTLLSLCMIVYAGANCSPFICAAYGLWSAPQTGLCAWLHLCWQVKPLLHEGFSVCSYCVMTTFQLLWATVWHSWVRQAKLKWIGFNHCWRPDSMLHQ